jgi:hypothetical protein
VDKYFLVFVAQIQPLDRPQQRANGKSGLNTSHSNLETKDISKARLLEISPAGFSPLKPAPVTCCANYL